MSMTLSPEVSELVRKKFEEGRYGSVEDVIDAALDALEERDRLRELRDTPQGSDHLESAAGVPYSANK